MDRCTSSVLLRVEVPRHRCPARKAARTCQGAPRAPLGSAAGFTIGDAATGPTLHFFVVPGNPIIFGYRGADDERRLRPLVDRCAEALDADVVLV